MNLHQKVGVGAIAALTALAVVGPAAAGAAAHTKPANKPAAKTKSTGSGSTSSTPKSKATTYDTPVAYPSFSTPGPIAPSPCGVSVAPFVQSEGADGDVTTAFEDAMSTALASQPDCYQDGPSGPQAVVYVPAGTYRLANLTFPSNLRLEVDAGAELRLPPNKDQALKWANVPMISWDQASKNSPALTNVSIVGVGQAMTDAKNAAVAAGGQAIAPFDLSTDFTMNLDPAATDSTNSNPGIQLVNVQNFLIQNVFSIQNDTDQSASNGMAWPTSARPVLSFNASKYSPLSGPYLQPRNGVVENHVDVHSPRGFGPNQITGADHVAFSDLYSQGGTTLRLETDGATAPNGQPDRGATADAITGQNIVGFDCNRALSLSPHAQDNGSVSVDGVWAYSCNQAVVARRDGAPDKAGRFGDVNVTNVNVDGGDQAQDDSTSDLWTVGTSTMTLCISPNLGWSPNIQFATVSGHFSTNK